MGTLGDPLQGLGRQPERGPLRIAAHGIVRGDRPRPRPGRGSRNVRVRTLKGVGRFAGGRAVSSDLYLEARAAAERGEAARALDLIARAHAASPDDPAVRELYAALELARGIRLSAAAREARRQDILRRDIGYDEEFVDSPEVRRAFDDALAGIDRALAIEPGLPKAVMMRAALLFRRDREANRAEALAALQALASAHPENRQIGLEIRRIERPCERCSDTGFCPDCGGRGFRRLFRLESKCEACHGQGICLACGIV